MSDLAWMVPVVPAALAVALLVALPGTSRLRRHGWLIALASSTVLLGAGLLVARGWPTSGRVVLVLDGPGLLEPTQGGLSSVVRQYAAAGMTACDVLLIQGAPPADGTCRVPPDLSSRAWRPADGCERIHLEEVLAAHDPDCALQLARRRLQENGPLGWLAAALRLSSQRIVVVASQPKKWTQSWLIDPVARLAELAPDGISVDLVHRSDHAPDEEPPTLALDLSAPRFPERQVDGTIDVRILSRALVGQTGLLRGTTRCELDLQEGSGFTLPPRVDDYVMAARDQAVLGRPIQLREFQGVAGASPYQLVRGYHLLKCSVTLRLPDGRELPTARGARYVDVGPRYFMVINGPTARFAPDGINGTRQMDIHALWGPSGGARRWTGDIAFGGVVPDAAFRASGLPPRAAPAVLVLHDLTPATWAARCQDLAQLVASGTTLLVSGAPTRTEAPGCAFLPAFARESGSRAVMVDRRPRLTFLLDPSRLGALYHRPQDGTAPPVAHLPTPASKYGAPRPLANGLAVQRALIDGACGALRALDADADCSELERDGSLRRRYVEGQTLPAKFEASATSAGREDQLARASQLSTRLAALSAGAPPPAVVRSNEVLVLFTYDVAQLDRASSELAKLLLRGVQVDVVLLRTPYSAGLGPLAGSRSLRDAMSVARQYARDGLVPSLSASSLFDGRALGERLRVDSSHQVDLDGEDPLAAAARAGEALGAELGRRLAPEAAIMVVHRQGRFVDGAMGPVVPDGVEPRWQTTPPGAWAAPLQFQVLERNEDVESAKWLSAVPAPGPGGGAPLSAPVGFAGLHGRGEVLVLGYSIFEGMTGEFFPGAPWRGRPQSRIALVPRAGPGDAWGPQRVADAVIFQRSIQPGPGEEPRIVDARVVDPSGRIELEVVQRLHSGGVVDRLWLTGCRAGGFSGACKPPDGARRMAGRIVGLDAASQRLTYTFAPSELFQVCGGARGCVATLERERAGGSAAPGEVRLFVDGVPGGASGAVADLPVLEALRALALYSGGAEILPGIQPSRSRFPVRSSAVRALVVAALLYWGVRLVQRWRAAAGLRLTSQRQARLSLAIDARGAVHSAGEALGRPQSALQVGAFAGFRPLEPGNRLSSVVRDDLVVYARARSLGRPTRLPRVARHIEELGRHVRIVVNVGMSMRTPAVREGRAGKLHAAANVCQLLAEVGWHFRSMVEVVPAGLRQAGETFGPAAFAGAAGAVAAHVLAQGKHPTPWMRLARMPEVDRPMSVVVVSDFLNDDLGALGRFAADVEEEGGLFGAVHVHIPEELQLLGAGVAPGFDLLCDRTSWSATDARLAHERFRDEVDVALGGYAGGFLSISGALQAPEILALVSEAPLLAVLR
ncbi:MAG TPA: hypothetical protein VFA20_32815 [Myxococcaceae bacterium]|nr:hypothetical protein [Myxococcaceae bacterium]